MLARRAHVWKTLCMLRCFHVCTSTQKFVQKSIKDLPIRLSSKALTNPVPISPNVSNEWPPLALGVMENMRSFPQCILLTRVGGFYESYFEQAPKVSRMLSIKLASRKWAGQSIPMAGFPIHQLEKYLKVLVQDHGVLVAICEEFKTSSSNAPFERRVTRVVSPGTLIDERFLDPFHNNFILAVSPPFNASSYGLAWLDVSTADFGTAVHYDAKALRDAIVRIKPREVVLVSDAFDRSHPVYEATDRVKAALACIPAPETSQIKTELIDATKAHMYEAENNAIQVLTSYLQTRLLDHMSDMSVNQSPLRASTDCTMRLDASTLSALEIRETQDQSTRGSLSSIVRRTVTQGGARLCVQWLTNPSMSLQLIREAPSAARGPISLTRPIICRRSYADVGCAPSAQAHETSICINRTYFDGKYVG